MSHGVPPGPGHPPAAATPGLRRAEEFPEGFSSVIVGAPFTNKGTEPVELVPSRGLCVIDSEQGTPLASGAQIASHPGFREGAVLPGETLAGHVFYLIEKGLDVRGVQWRDGADTLTWLR